MNILITIDENYVMPALVMLESLFCNAKENISVYIVYSDVKETSRNRIESVSKRYDQDVEFVHVQPAFFEKAHTSIHITKAAYYRLLAYELLPNNLDRVLYLDPDMIIQKDLAELYNTEFKTESEEPCYYVVCEGPGVSRKEWQVYDNFGIPHDKLYFNSGVMLMNLSALRQDVRRETVLEFVQKNNQLLKYHDQDTLNALFYNNLRYVDWHIYNQTILHIKSEKEAQTRQQDAAIIHFAGSDKPWNYDYKSYYFSLFWKYAWRAGFRMEYIKTCVRRTIWHIRNRINS